MVTHGSYDLAEFAADKKGEIERLKAQVDLFWDQELALFRRLGLSDGMSVLDCGCGPGHLLARLKGEYPGLVCTGVDVDAELTEVATERLSEVGDCTVLQQSACAMQLPDNAFDLVISRLVLEHLPEPAKAAREILRVLKPGGTAIIIDNDFDLHECTFPACSSLKELYAAYRQARRAEGGNPCIGRELPLLLASVGFEGVQMQTLAAHSHITGDSAFFRAEGSGIPAQLVKSGYLSAEALERITMEWMHMLQSPSHAIFRVLLAGIGRKPTDSKESSRAGDARFSMPAPQSEAPNVRGAAAVSTDNLSVDVLRKFMRDTLAAEMDMDAESFDCGEPLIHLGVDSIAAMHLCNRTKTWLSVNLPVAEILCGKSINVLADEVFARFTAERASVQPAILPQPRLG
jgi:ubiquinone/menaquinone biosynthesis C-methylase UbiE